MGIESHDTISDSHPNGNNPFDRKSFFEQTQKAGRIGSFILDMSGPSPEDQRWQSSAIMDEIFGVDAAFPKTGRNWLGLIVGSAEVEAYFSRQTANLAKTFDMVYQIRRVSDSALRWIHALGEFQYGADGKPSALIGTVRDITELKNAEDDLRVFRLSVDFSSDAVFWLDRNAHITYANRQACISLGYTEEEMLRLSLRDIDPVFPIEVWEINWKNYTEERRGETIESVHKRRDGSTFPVEVVSTHLIFSDNELHIAVVRDISERKKMQQQLLDSEKKVSRIIQNLPAGIHLYRLEDNDRLVFDGSNPAANRILGVDYSMFIGKTIEEAFPALIETEVPARYRKAAKDGTPWATEQITYHEGKIAGAYEVIAFQTEPGRMAAVFSDISERKRTEEALKFQNLLLTIQQESSPDGILVAGENGRILYSNRKFARMWNIPDELIAAGDETPALAYAVQQTVDPEQFVNRVKDLYRSQNESSFDEFSLKDGRIFERYSSPIIGENHYYGRVWQFRDITGHRKSEKALIENEAEFRSLFESSPSGAILVKNRIMKRVSAKFVEITGYTQEELIGNTTRMIYPDEEEYERVGREIYSAMAIHGMGRCETKICRKDGTLIDVLIYATPLDPADPGKGVTATIEDISPRKKAEAEKEKLQSELLQAQKMESIGRLAGGIAHDFNNLLTAIMGNTELALLRTPPEAAIHPQLAVIMQAAESASELTRQLLSFSRKQIIDPKIVNINAFLDTMHKMLTRVIGEDIRLRSVSQPDLRSTKVDISQIQQIIMNLAINARDAMPDGGILSIETANVVLDEVFCRRHAYPIPGEHVMIAVSDTGIGMSRETQDHLFEPFFTTKAIGKGTGLGLATVYGAVKQNNGVIDVYSEPGKGSCFKVYFPAVAGSPDASPIRTDETIPGGSETILLVEDNPMVLRFAESALRLLGYTVYTASSGEEALEVLDESTMMIDLVMTDVILSGMNGKALAEKIGEKYPHIKILFNSGYTEDAIIAHGVLDGELNFIGKPFSAAALARKIREVLAK
jgi:PAS domain S-box-containing protein